MPTIALDRRKPKKWVGKCPTGISDEMCEQLLNEAIPAPTGDRETSFPKAVYVVYQGAIYEAQTSDHGCTYHGYPYRGRLSGSLVKTLRGMAQEKDCLDEFDHWVKTHIEARGSGR